MSKTIINLVIIILTAALASSAIAQDDSSLRRGIVIVYPFGVEDVKIQKDGKILLCGLASIDVTPRYKTYQAILHRRNADGSPDQTFGKSGMVTTKEIGSSLMSCKLALQEDGKVIIAGTTNPLVDPVEREKYRNTGKSNRDVLVARYATNGQLDKSFNGSGWVQTDIDGRWDDARGLTIQNDGKIIVVGSSLRGGILGKMFDFMILRYNENGTLDERFGERGKVIHRVRGFMSDAYPHAVAVQGDGKIIVVGEANGLGDMDQNMALVRYKSNGSTDWTFGLLGKVIVAKKQFGGGDYSIALQPGGKIIVGVSGWSLTCFNSDGSLDDTYGTKGKMVVGEKLRCDRDSGCSSFRGRMAFQSDGKIILLRSAFFKEKSGTLRATILCRSNVDGTLDASFGQKGLTRLAGLLGEVIAVQLDGKIIVAGGFYPGTDDKKKSSPYKGAGLIRLNTDGRIDETFGAGLPVLVHGNEAVDKTEDRVTKRETAASSSRAADSPDPALGRGDNRTVLLGTYSWDVESNKQGNISTSDFWWSQGSDTRRDLVPVHRTTWKVITDRNYDEIDKAFIRAQKLDKRWLSGSDDEYAVLVPGVVIVFRTGEGNFGKMQVERYRSLHDFSFPEAVYLDDSWREMVLKEPNREKYHLQVKWHLFR